MSSCEISSNGDAASRNGAVKLNAPVLLSEVATKQEDIESKETSVWIIEKDTNLVSARRRCENVDLASTNIMFRDL